MKRETERLNGTKFAEKVHGAANHLPNVTIISVDIGFDLPRLTF